MRWGRDILTELLGSLGAQLALVGMTACAVRFGQQFGFDYRTWPAWLVVAGLVALCLVNAISGVLLHRWWSGRRRLMAAQRAAAADMGSNATPPTQVTFVADEQSITIVVCPSADRNWAHLFGDRSTVGAADTDWLDRSRRTAMVPPPSTGRKRRQTKRTKDSMPAAPT